MRILLAFLSALLMLQAEAFRAAYVRGAPCLPPSGTHRALHVDSTRLYQACGAAAQSGSVAFGSGASPNSVAVMSNRDLSDLGMPQVTEINPPSAIAGQSDYIVVTTSPGYYAVHQKGHPDSHTRGWLTPYRAELVSDGGYDIDMRWLALQDSEFYTGHILNPDSDHRASLAANSRYVIASSGQNPLTVGKVAIPSLNASPFGQGDRYSTVIFDRSGNRVRVMPNDSVGGVPSLHLDEDVLLRWNPQLGASEGIEIFPVSGLDGGTSGRFYEYLDVSVATTTVVEGTRYIVFGTHSGKLVALRQDGGSFREVASVSLYSASRREPTQYYRERSGENLFGTDIIPISIVAYGGSLYVLTTSRYSAGELHRLKSRVPGQVGDPFGFGRTDLVGTPPLIFGIELQK